MKKTILFPLLLLIICKVWGMSYDGPDYHPYKTKVPAGIKSISTYDTSCFYDEDGNIIRITARDSEYIFYDSLRLKIGHSVNVENYAYNSNEYSSYKETGIPVYDEYNRLIMYITVDPSSVEKDTTDTYSYDDNGKLIVHNFFKGRDTSVQPFTSTRYFYDTDGRLFQMAVNDIKTTYYFDEQGRPSYTEVTYPDGDERMSYISDFYLYDNTDYDDYNPCFLANPKYVEDGISYDLRYYYPIRRYHFFENGKKVLEKYIDLYCPYSNVPYEKIVSDSECSFLYYNEFDDVCRVEQFGYNTDGTINKDNLIRIMDMTTTYDDSGIWTSFSFKYDILTISGTQEITYW